MMSRTFRIHGVLTLAVPALVVIGSAGVEAQRPFNDRDLEKMSAARLQQLPLPPDNEEAIVAAVRKTPAPNLGSGLPVLELDEWLREILLSYNPHAAPLEWRLERCEDFTSDFPDYSAELCVVASSENISRSGEKSFTLILGVGEWSRAGEGRWVLRPPAIRDLFVQNASNSLDIRSLSELTAAFDVPPDRWPTVEFELSLDASPLRALPGDTVNLRIQVRNTGKRDAPRAEIQFGGVVGDTPDDVREYRYQWFPAIAAGQTVAVELPCACLKGAVSSMRGRPRSVVASASRKPIPRRKPSQSGCITCWIRPACLPSYPVTAAPR
jgi:hypothetical protein